ncbi:AAA family ATPase [Labedella endophytica]|jgi:MoxR-like ATPase|uniref:AAA family ATPase n=1 Tax=Labedella endophytica TaxID=1523160 RepID=A0A3S0XN77_9MICO|nr:AAA family ATPase [Labedella endophytica]
MRISDDRLRGTVSVIEQPTTTTTVTREELERARGIISAIASRFDEKVVGQSSLRTSLLVALLTGGHVLLESVPGLAKTTAAETIADAVGGSFRRIQCTPDLLPSDIVGTQIYDPRTAEFTTQLGPVHANFVLLDEVNRSSAKTQSAMLEAMQEKQTSVGGVNYALPEPFLVLATQNPIEQEGTYHLPEAQLDRFLIKEVLDYPSIAEEAEIVRRVNAGVFRHESRAPRVSVEDVLFLQSLVPRIYLDQAILAYIVQTVYVTRNVATYLPPKLASYVEYGASPRASIAFATVARALALLAGREHVIPEDVKAYRHQVLRHRLILGFEAIADDVKPETVIDAIFGVVQVP